MNNVQLIDPKYAHNLGAVVRAISVFGGGRLRWTGGRADAGLSRRLPREERLRDYKERVDFERSHSDVRPLDQWPSATPVAVEVRDNAEDLVEFEHPMDAVYVFGPEDGSLDRATLTACHRFVTIPTEGCLNLGAAVNVVLYDRFSKTPTKGAGCSR